MKATVHWQNNMVFIGSSASGFPVRMDADSSFGGMESGVRPMEMIALGLFSTDLNTRLVCTCLGIDWAELEGKKNEAPLTT